MAAPTVKETVVIKDLFGMYHIMPIYLTQDPNDNFRTFFPTRINIAEGVTAKMYSVGKNTKKVFYQMEP